MNAACKKQYSCQCSTTYEKPGYYPYTVSTIQEIKGKTRKRRAEQICAHAEKQMFANHTDYKSGDETLTVSCAVKIIFYETINFYSNNCGSRTVSLR